MFPLFKHQSFLELNPIIINQYDLVVDVEFSPHKLYGTIINFIHNTNNQFDLLTLFLDNGNIKLGYFAKNKFL